MASIVQICNMALSHIGSDARVSSISPPDGSAEAGYCATFYDQARTEMLEPGNWSFSLKRSNPPELVNPSDAWAYAYSRPSDALRVLRVLRPGVAVTVFTQDRQVYPHTDDRDGAPFDVEGQTIYSNQPDVTLVYVRDITDATKFTPSFVAALSYLLASYLAGPIIKGAEGLRLSNAMREQAMSLADLSATASANASSADNMPQPNLLAVRA
jgi:hypothetical protein